MSGNIKKDAKKPRLGYIYIKTSILRLKKVLTRLRRQVMKCVLL